MANIILFLLSFALFAPFSSSTFQTFSKGSSLSRENPEDVLTSPNDVFSAGFYSVKMLSTLPYVWMANCDQPVNGKCSKLSLLKNGNLIITDAGKFTIWTTNTFSLS
ncbi:putative receptor protein kinase zmpk1 [Quercus suber]|uniref:Receptor protein kinase zmpk1 n=1 Tax=Quercus suber TaxID=58331 RepID=A0AAW0M7M1_QUESU